MSNRYNAKCPTRKPMNVKKVGGRKCDFNGDPVQEAQEGFSLAEPGYKFFRKFDYKPSIIFDILVLVTIAVQAYLYIKYAIILKDPQAEGMFFYNGLNIMFCVVGRFLPDFIFEATKTGKFNLLNLRKEKSAKESNFSFLDAIVAGGVFILIVATQSLRFVKLNVSKLDQFLFYTFAAPAEEAFFRYLLTAVPIVIYYKIQEIFRLSPNITYEIITKAAVGFIVGMIFGYAHVQRYEGADLLVIVLNGIEFSIIYAFIRRIDGVLLAHLFVNMRYGVEILLS